MTSLVNHSSSSNLLNSSMFNPQSHYNSYKSSDELTLNPHYNGSRIPSIQPIINGQYNQGYNSGVGVGAGTSTGSGVTNTNINNNPITTSNNNQLLPPHQSLYSSPPPINLTSNHHSQYTPQTQYPQYYYQQSLPPQSSLLPPQSSQLQQQQQQQHPHQHPHPQQQPSINQLPLPSHQAQAQSHYVTYYQPYSSPSNSISLDQPLFIGQERKKSKQSSTWTPKEDKLLRNLKEVQKLGWREISTFFNDRTPNACQFRWRRIISGTSVSSASSGTNGSGTGGLTSGRNSLCESNRGSISESINEKSEPGSPHSISSLSRKGTKNKKDHHSISYILN